MNGLYTQMVLLDGAAAVVAFAANWLLQSTLLIAGGLACGWLLRGRGAALQSAVYRTTLIAALACPLATSLFALGGVSGWSLEMPTAWVYEQVSTERDDALPPQPVVAALPLPLAPVASLPLELPPHSTASLDSGIATETQEPRDSLADLSASAGAADSRPPGSSSAVGGPAVTAAAPGAVTAPAETWLFEIRAFGLVAMALSTLWLLVSGVLLLRLAFAWRRLSQLRRRAVPVDAETTASCRELAALLAVAPPEVLRSPYLASPCLAGLVRCAVLLPDEGQALPLRDVLVHELAHLRRGDCAWNLLRRVAEALFFFQPLLWILARRLETSAEEVCDDYVVQYGGDREQYARQLVDIAEFSSVPVGAAGVGMVSLRSILAKRVERIMDTSRSLSTRAGSLLLTVVVAGGLAGTITVGFVGLGQQRSLANTQPAAEEEASRATNGEANAESDTGGKREDVSKANNATEKAKPLAGDNEPKPEAPFEGRVTGADGKPAKGAKLYWIRSRVHDIRPEPPQLVATTGDEGKYRFAPPPPVVSEKDPASWSYSDRIVITAPGHGFQLTWPHGLREAASQPQGFLRALGRAVTGGAQGPTSLPAAGEPIRGRLVDINGQPVVGATIRIRWFSDERDRRGSVREAEVRGAKNAAWKVWVNDLLNVIEPVQLREVLPSATTDDQGRFELKGIGPQRLVQLLVEGEGIETTEIVARNEPGEKLVIEPDRHGEDEPQTVYPNELLHAVGPSKPVEGRVLDLDTGEPIADAVVRAFLVHGERVHSSREREHFAARTDAEGRYRITGLPIGADNRLVAFATGEVPYIPVGHVADTSAPGTTIQRDIRLKRGIWAEGRVFDAESGQPFTGEISYYYFRDRELEASIPGLRSAFVDGLYWTNANGEFRVPVLPSRGILAYRYDGMAFDREGIDRFPRGYGAEGIAGAEGLGGAMAFPTEPHYLMPGNYERVAEVRPAPGQETVRVDMPLVASPLVTLRVVDAEGQPVTKFQAYGANERFGWQRLDGPEFEIQDMMPGERRKVFVFHRGRNLAGGGYASYEQKEVVEIKLLEAGSVEGRLVDADGEPIDDATLTVQYDKLQSDDRSAIWAPHPDLSASPTQIPVDKDGRFHLGGLIPGWRYHARASAPRKYQGDIVSMGIGEPFQDVEIKAGEQKDLGDIVIGGEKEDADKQADKEEASAAGESSQADTEARQEPSARSTPPASAAGANVVRGRVTLPGGQPAAGAHVAVVARKVQTLRGGDFSPSGDVLAQGVADEQGQYALRLAGASSQTHRYANVIAREDGAAIAWQQINLDAQETEAALALVPEEPIRGKLIDIEGQPAAGVKVASTAVMERTEGAAPTSGVGYDGAETPAAWLPPVTSDEAGRFTIHGVPANHGVYLELEGSDRFAPQDIVLNTGMSEQRGERDGTYRPLVTNVKPGEEAVLPLAPAQVFEGVVRFADSGEPAPHARIRIWASQQEFAGSMVSVAGVADEKGRYRVYPRPGVRFGLTAYPPDGTPYLARQTPTSESIRWEAGDRVKQVDLALPRGVLVRGTVLEAGTEAPVAGAAVQYIPESSNNPNDSDDILTGWQAIQLSDEKGKFSIAVLPGPGRLLVHAHGNYVFQEIGTNQLDRDKPGGARSYAHAIEKINPDVGGQSLDVHIELTPGATATGRIVDERGEPVEETLMISRLSISPHGLIWRGHTTPTLGGRFELVGLAEDVEYPVYFLDAKRRLGATATLQAGDESTIVLRPCGSAKLRVVDANGQPVAGHYEVNVEMVVTPGVYRFDTAAMRKGELTADADYVSNIDHINYPGLMKSDPEGFLDLPALIPGATYTISAAVGGRRQVVKQFQARASETLDLGELVVETQE